MRRVNENDVPWVERRSPKGRYHKFRRHLAGAMERDGAGTALPERPPFEVEQVRLPPGSANFPFHAHSGEWECYLIVAGAGTMRSGGDRVAIKAGDHIICPPGDAHQIVNDGDGDLIYYVIADHVPGEVWHYPDSNKWGFQLPDGEELYFRPTPVEYYDDEE